MQILQYWIVASLIWAAMAHNRGCILDTFEDETLGSYQETCSTIGRKFTIEKYSDNPLIPRRTEATNIFIMPNRTEESCIQQNVELNGERELTIAYYSRNYGAPYAIPVLIFDASNDTIIESNYILVDNSQTWSTIVININTTAQEIFIQLQSDKLDSGAVLAIDYILLNYPGAEVCLEILPTTTVKPLRCFLDDFEDNSLGSYQGNCSSIVTPFTLEKYSNYPEIPARTNSSEIFIMPDKNATSCIQSSVEFKGEQDMELTISFYARNYGDVIALPVVLMDASNYTVIEKNFLLIDNSQAWQTVTFTIEAEIENNILIQLQSESFSSGAVVAIDYIMLKYPGAEECIDIMETMTKDSFTYN